MEITVGDDLGQFMQILFEDHVGLLCTGRISGTSGRDGRGIDTQEWFEWPRQADEFFAWHTEHEDEDLYFSPMLYGQRRRNKETVITTPVVWADTDEAEPGGFALLPTFYTETSPGKYHCYWKMNENISPEWAEQMSRIVTESRKEDGSDNGWALTKFLRLPGALNTKPSLEQPHRVTYTFEGLMYTPDEMIKSYGEAQVAAKMGLLDTEVPDVLPNYADVMRSLPPHPDVMRLLQEPPRTKDFSQALFRLECDLFRLGCTAPEVFVLCMEAPCNKFARDNRPDVELWRDVLKAEFSVSNAPAGAPKRGIKDKDGKTSGQVDIDDEEINELAMIGPIPRPEFITKAERMTLQPTIIDQYTDWAATKTNADRRYHEYSAIALISTIFSEFGHAMPKFGKLILTLWVMILGQTTRTYKSTSKNLMLQVFNRIQGDDDSAGFDYEIGSDATTEGLLMALADRPGRSNIFHRDEAQSMLADTKGGKGYMGGFTETLTELYDGRVRARLRATGQNKKIPAVDTQLVLYLMGVPDRVAEILTPNDFASGFLARFLYVVGTPGPRTVDNMRLEQAPLNKSNEIEIDARFENVVKKLRTARKWWTNKVEEPGKTLPIMVEPDAWERFNEAIVMLNDIAASSELPDLLEPSVDRMNKSILKLACLLAMVDKRKTANMHDMLTAISMAEGWYVSLHQVARMVGASQFATQVRELLRVVRQNGGQMRYTSARRTFGSMAQRDWLSILDGAVDQGYITVGTDSRGKIIYEGNQ